VGVGSAAGDAAFLLKGGTGPDGGEGEGDDDEGEDVGVEFRDVDRVLQD